MAEIKVSQLPEASEINDNDLIMIVQNNVNKKITKENCKFASGDEVAVSDTEPTGEESDSVKLWINPEETPSGSLNPITNEYSVATDKGYSCNYVNDLVNYSTSEVNTGKKWIDGKPIYRKVVDLGSIVDAVENTWTTITNVSTLNISKIIDCKAISNNGCIWSGYLIRISNGNLQFNNGVTTWGSNIIILEYTKTTD